MLFLYRGISKMPFCCIGGKKCIGGQILAYLGNFCILYILRLRVDLHYLVGIAWTGLGPGRHHSLDRAL